MVNRFAIRGSRGSSVKTGDGEGDGGALLLANSNLSVVDAGGSVVAKQLTFGETDAEMDEIFGRDESDDDDDESEENAFFKEEPPVKESGGWRQTVLQRPESKEGGEEGGGGFTTSYGVV